MIETILHKIGMGIVTVGVAISSLFGFHAPAVQAPAPSQNVGATIPTVVATFQSSLQASITATATSMTLVSGTDKAGNSLSGYICFNIDEGTSVEEFVCGTTSGTAVSAMIRGIDPVDGDLEVTALKKIHRRGAVVKITNYPSLAVISRVINGTEAFPNALSYTTNPTFTDSKQIPDKHYVDTQNNVGAGNADTTTQGLVEIPTQAEVDAGTQLGGSGAFLGTNPALTRAKKYHDYAADSVGTDSYAITITPAITAYATGQVFTFKAGTANTGAATLNVSGLGAKTIKKDVTTDLATGDILANQIVTVEYDGTNMQLQSTSAGVKDASQATGILPIANGGTASSTGVGLGFPAQDIPFATGTVVMKGNFITSNSDGSVIYFTAETTATTTATIYRAVRDANTGNYYITHTTTLAATSVNGIAVVGSNVYVSAVISAANSLRKYAIADLSGVTTVTFSGTSRAGDMWSDGTDLYIQNGATSQYEKFTISGTVATNAGAITYTSSNAGTGGAAISDGTSVWIYDLGLAVRKYAKAGGAASATTTTLMLPSAYPNWDGAGSVASLFWGGKSTFLGIGWGYNLVNDTAVKGMALHLMAITTP